jgi:hypothetical protein
MKATDIIRELLCLIDVIDTKQQQTDPEIPSVQISTEIPQQELNDTPRRFKQIFDILSAEREGQYANSPTEVVAGIESVTTDAGGGLNGPKHPHDLRVKDPSMHPNQQGF